MYDHETESLWSTFAGEPVVGPLVGKGIKLKRRQVVTTTWGKWKKRHPNTRVLSLDTGHERDYGEGVAYNWYFADDVIKYKVPVTDKRFANKAEVFALRRGDDQLAISIPFLQKQNVFREKIGDLEFVVFSDRDGTSRAYEVLDNEVSGNKFISFDGVDGVMDSDGNKWRLTEQELTYGDKVLKRIPSHRAFWFGWFSQFPQTRLIK